MAKRTVTMITLETIDDEWMEIENVSSSGINPFAVGNSFFRSGIPVEQFDIALPPGGKLFVRFRPAKVDDPSDKG